MEYLTVRDAAKKWNISERWVQQYCIEERIGGVKKFGVSWAIPADAEKPADPRKIKKRFGLRMYERSIERTSDERPLGTAFQSFLR